MDKRSYEKKHLHLDDALSAIRSREMTIRKAAVSFSIPLTTLARKVQGKCVRKPGRPTTLTEEEEAQICEILLQCMKIGVPLNKRMLMKVVKAIGVAKGKTEVYPFYSLCISQ